MITEFSVPVFKENEEKTENARVLRERIYYTGILLFLIAIILYLLDLYNYAVYAIWAGALVITIARIIMSGRITSIGHRPYEFKITLSGLVIRNTKIDLDITKDIYISVVAYKGQGINQQEAYYQMYSGNENMIKFSYKGKQTEFRFVLDSEYEMDKLIKFCKENGIRYNT